MITTQQLNAKYSDESALVLINYYINGRTIDEMINIHNEWTLRTDSTLDLEADESEYDDENDDYIPVFSEFVFDLQQINIYRIHKLAISLFNNSANDEFEYKIYAILAIETSKYLIDGISEKELRRTNASFGNIKNFINQKKMAH